MKSKVLILLASMSAVLSVQANDNLDIYIKRIKSRPAGAIAPVPEFIIPEAHLYSTGHLRDPFQQLKSIDSYQPDLSRSKEPLEGYALDALRMVGSYTRRNPKTKKIEHWAFIATPDQTIHPVTIGHHIGRHLGRIKTVNQNEITLIEEVKTHTGWGKRPASLMLSDKQR